MRKIILSLSKNHATLEFLEPVLQHCRKNRFPASFGIYSNSPGNEVLNERIGSLLKSGDLQQVRYFGYKESKTHQWFRKAGLEQDNMWGKSLRKLDTACKLSFNKMKKKRVNKALERDKPAVILLENSLLPQTIWLNQVLVDYARKNQTKLVVLPHAPHKGQWGYSSIPEIDNFADLQADFWMAANSEFLRDDSSQYQVEHMGYPPFDEEHISGMRSKIAANKDVPDVLVLLREIFKKPKNFLHMSRTKAVSLLQDVINASLEQGYRKIVLKPHPSIKPQEMDILLKKLDRGNLIIEVSFAPIQQIIGPKTVLLGSYTTIFLFAGLLKVKALLLHDAVLENVQREAPHLFQFYSEITRVIEPAYEDISRAFRNGEGKNSKNVEEIIYGEFRRDSIEKSVSRLQELLKKP